MTREEAIEVLKHTTGNINWDANREEIYFTDEWVQAYEMAIAALKEQDVTDINCEDTNRLPVSEITHWMPLPSTEGLE